MSQAALHLACGETAALLAQAPDPERWLSASERERLAPLRSTQRRGAFIAARWQARWMLAGAFGGDPVDWSLEAPQDAPPRVTRRPELFLSISHSGALVATALGLQPVGIDLEVPKAGRDIAGLLGLCCTAAERDLFVGLHDDERAAMFHELWTVKEAWLKRRGDWLAPSRLQQIDVAPTLSGEIRTWRGPSLQLAVCSDGAQSLHWWTPEPPRWRGWAVRCDRLGLTAPGRDI